MGSRAAILLLILLSSLLSKAQAASCTDWHSARGFHCTELEGETVL